VKIIPKKAAPVKEVAPTKKSKAEEPAVEQPKAVKRKTKAVVVDDSHPLWVMLKDEMKFVDELPTWDFYYRGDMQMVLDENPIHDHVGVALRQFRRGLFVTETGTAQGTFGKNYYGKDMPVTKAFTALLEALEAKGVIAIGHLHLVPAAMMDKAYRKRVVGEAVERLTEAENKKAEVKKVRAEKTKARSENMKQISETDETDELNLDEDEAPAPKKKASGIKLKIGGRR
jgi:hypothetical protein